MRKTTYEIAFHDNKGTYSLIDRHIEYNSTKGIRQIQDETFTRMLHDEKIYKIQIWAYRNGKFFAFYENWRDRYGWKRTA